MTFPHKPLPPGARPSFDADAVRISVLGLIALIVGTMLAYDFVRPLSNSASAPFPRPRPSASDAPPVHAANSLPREGAKPAEQPQIALGLV
jgi:hypothetical protein